MVRTRPIVGVTGPDRGGLAAWSFTWLAVRRAGGRAIRITPSRPRSTAGLDALVLGGGADVAEKIGAVEAQALESTEPRHPRGMKRLLAWLVAPLVFIVRWLLASRRRMAGDADRDRLELALITEARRHGIPTLGICRGAQLMAVAEGGTLLRNVAEQFAERPDLRTVLPRRRVRLIEGTTLRTILGADEVLANSLHRDAVRDVAGRLRVAAVESDTGVVQAIEDPSGLMWCGVQWHPEYLPQSRVHERLFTALVADARFFAARLAVSDSARPGDATSSADSHDAGDVADDGPPGLGIRDHLAESPGRLQQAHLGR